VVFGCVAEDRPLYLAESLFLLQSLRWFGGALAGAPFVVCVVEEVDDDYAALFQELGASVRVVERVSARHSHSNKLRFLEAPELADCDVAVLLDCDTIVVGDPLPWLDREQFQARMAGNPSVPHSVFERLFGSGATPDTAAELLSIADGLIVGTSLKRNGDVAAPVDPERVRRLVAAAR